MITILFSPSEEKNDTFTHTKTSLFGGIDSRNTLLKSYINILLSEDEKKIKELFGVKNLKAYSKLLDEKAYTTFLPAIERYSGVAFKYFDYQSLQSREKEYILNNCMIFSNLYGPIMAKDTIINYKLKQGTLLDTLDTAKFYSKHFKKEISEYLKESIVVDLRASYYEKFYKHKAHSIVYKFLKNNKVLSHWVKAYRGLVLRALAQNNIKTKEQLLSMPIDGLELLDVIQTENKTQLIYKIVD